MISSIRNIKALRRLHTKYSSIGTKKLHSKFPKIEVPNIHLEELLWKNLDKWSNKTALVCAETKRSYTYLEFYNKTNALAVSLHKFSKLRKSDTVAIILPNLPEYAIVLLGAIQAGFKIITIDPNYTADDIRKQLHHSESKLVFTMNEMYNVIAGIVHSTQLRIPIISLKTKKGTSLPRGAIDFDDIVQETSNTDYRFEKHLDDTLLIPFSSGTSGLPKGIELSNRNIVSSLNQMSVNECDALADATESHQEVLPIFLPLYHLYGIMLLLFHGMQRGSKLVFTSKVTPKIFVDVLANYSPTVLYLVPPIFHLMLKNMHTVQSHIASIKTMRSAAAPLGAKDVEAWNEKVGGRIGILQMYGLTETCTMTHTQSEVVTNGAIPGGTGFLIPLTEARVVSTGDEKEMGANQVGEIHIRGPQVMKGYYNNEKANQETFTSDGWLKTGDVGYYNDDGHFFITDRIKELIKVKAHQVAPAELEELLRHHPEVDEVAVVGVPHKTFGEVPKAFVVRKRSSTVTAPALQQYTAQRVVNYKQLIGGVTFVQSIPKSATGKILRKELRNLHQ